MKTSYNVPIVSLEEIAKNTVEIGLDISGTDFSFRSGQYISIVQPELEEQSIKEAYREFSIASAATDPVLRVAFRKSDSVFKTHLLTKKVGDRVTIEGPFGVFYAPDSANDVVYIAGGIGVTGFTSELHDPHPGRHIRVYTFNQDDASTPYKRDLEKLSETHGFELHQYNGRAAAEHFVLSAVPHTCFLVAGPNGFVQTIRERLIGMGIMKEKIQTEEFTGYA